MRIHLIILVILLSSYVSAETPRTIALDFDDFRNENNTLQTGVKNITFNFYSNAVGGGSLFTDVQTLNFTSVGEETAVLRNITLDGNQTIFLGVAIDAGPELAPRTEFTSVFSAFFCDVAGSVLGGGFDLNITTDSGSVVIEDGEVLSVVGTGGITTSGSGNVVTINVSGINSSVWNETSTAIFPSDFGKNVGINTTTPTHTLVINGNVRITSLAGGGCEGSGTVDADADGVLECGTDGSGGGGSGLTGTVGPYLFDNTTDVSFNETKLNNTIEVVAPNDGYFHDLAFGVGGAVYNFSQGGGGFVFNYSN